MTPHPDTERLRYEIEAKTTFHSDFYNRSEWPNKFIQLDMWGNGMGQYLNSIGKHIATFRLKAWK